MDTTSTGQKTYFTKENVLGVRGPDMPVRKEDPSMTVVAEVITEQHERFIVSGLQRKGNMCSKPGLGVGSSNVADVKGYLSPWSVSKIQKLPSPSDWMEALLCVSCGHYVNHDYLMCAKEGHLTCNWCWRNKHLSCQFTADKAKSFENADAAETDSSGSTSATDEESDQSGGAEEGSQSGGSSVVGDTEAIGTEHDQATKNEKETPTSGSEYSDDDWESLLGLKVGDTPIQSSICEGMLIRRRHVFVDGMLGKVQLFCPNWENGCPVTLPINKIEYHYKERCRYHK